MPNEQESGESVIERVAPNRSPVDSTEEMRNRYISYKQMCPVCFAYLRTREDNERHRRIKHP